MAKNKIFDKQLREKEVPAVLPILGEPYEDTGIIAPNRQVGSGGSGITDGDKGDITVSGSGTVWTVDNGAITAAKLNQMGASNGQVIKWNGTTWVASADNDTTYSAGQALTLTGTTFSISQAGATNGQVLKWNGTGWFPANDLTSAGIQLFEYSAGNGAYVVATGNTVTFAKNSGVGTFTIPEGIKLISARIHGTSSDLQSNMFSVVFAGHFLNGTKEALYPPSITKYDRGIDLDPSEAIPYVYDIDNTPQVQITGINPLRVRVINLNGIVNWGLKFQM